MTWIDITDRHQTPREIAEALVGELEAALLAVRRELREQAPELTPAQTEAIMGEVTRRFAERFRAAVPGILRDMYDVPLH
jgi:hypothetical protein